MHKSTFNVELADIPLPELGQADAGHERARLGLCGPDLLRWIFGLEIAADHSSAFVPIAGLLCPDGLHGQDVGDLVPFRSGGDRHCTHVHETFSELILRCLNPILVLLACGCENLLFTDNPRSRLTNLT